MCGIAGVVNLNDGAPPDDELLRRMAGTIVHRGPDEFGIYRDPTAGLAHTRLSIIDLTTGQQPLSNEYGDLWIVYNGEVYNYVELRGELEHKGHRFRTVSDTEVVVHAFEEWGEEAFVRFNGQFALALWDRNRRQMTLARDRFGIRPLYYTIQDGRFYFASEVKAIFSDPRVSRAIDPEGIDQVFTFWTTLAPVTPFLGVRELRPGHSLVLDPKRCGGRELAEKPYWIPSYPERGGSYTLSIEDAADALMERLEKATRLRMLRSDVPVGSYLSGGIDSSVIALLGRKAKQGTFRTFSIRFADSEFDETIYQRMMVDHLDSEHSDMVCQRSDISDVFPSVVYHTERPVLRTAPAPLYILSRLVRNSGFKVVLTGEASDEILAGYDIFREAKVRAFWARQPDSRIRPRLLERLYPYLERSPAAARAMAVKFFGQGLDRTDAPEFAHIPRWNAASSLKRLFSRDFKDIASRCNGVAKLLSEIPADFENWDPLSRAQYLEIKTILSGYILSCQGDRMLMAHSVEGRFPFLDPDVIDFCNGLPPTYKLRFLDEKHILKRGSIGLLPEPIIRRPKQPYRAPDAYSFVGSGSAAWVDDMMSESSVRQAGMFEPSAVSRLLTKCRAVSERGQLSNADNMALVGILSSQLLWARFISGTPETHAISCNKLKSILRSDDLDPNTREE